MSNKQTIISTNKNYYDRYNCKFTFCESCYWFATILVDKFNNTNHCYNGRKRIFIWKEY